MATYIALLRGINVSGKNIIKMETLRDLCVQLELKDVSTYIQSGNIVFSYKKTTVAKLASMIHDAILKELQLDVAVIVLELSTLQSILNSNPYLKTVANQKLLYVTILAEIPSSQILNNTKKHLPDEYVIIDDVVYIHVPNGYGKTKLSNTYFESQLKTKATTRNWNTMGKLVEIAEGYKEAI